MSDFNSIMDLPHQLYISFQIFCAFLLGGFIGFERERHRIGAGIRTYAAVCMGAAMFTIIGNSLMDAQGASRMVSNVITGVGFLGAGLIFKDNEKQRAVGLTTAATVWSTAAVGVAVGYHLYTIAITSAVALYFLLALDEYKWYKKWRKSIRVEKEDDDFGD
jgi:putative Mg2+ transporter-C (MgtC) family protein